MSNVRLVIYHNPSCSKSRETLQILENNNLNPMIVEYLDNPPTRQELKKIIEMLGISARDLLRTTEQIYADARLDREALSEDEIIAVICQHPALLQRPIVVSGDRAVIGRPPARVLEIIA
ncbi:MAG: arsenate reductase (glutaredoxin) [Gammaproteobacteria bacterium]